MKVTDFDPSTQADMYLPGWLLVLGCILLIVGVVFAVCFFYTWNVFLVIGALCCIGLGVAAIMCWKNQKIRVLSQTKFEYTTFLGNSYVYAFQDITQLKWNSDSMTLFVGDNKVHIESSAILSKRLVDLLEQALQSKSE